MVPGGTTHAVQKGLDFYLWDNEETGYPSDSFKQESNIRKVSERSFQLLYRQQVEQGRDWRPRDNDDITVVIGVKDEGELSQTSAMKGRGESRRRGSRGRQAL